MNPLGSPSINSVPNSILLDGSFTFSGTWPNAHHTATSVDGANWDETTGESFSRVITLNTLGSHTVSVSARNTPDATDYESESDTRSYTVNVVAVPLPDSLGTLSMTDAVPAEVNIDESFTISGTWPNAHHTATSIDGIDWQETTGESFSRIISINTLGQHSISISARNTPEVDAPGTDNKTSNFTVNVVGVPVIVEALGNLTMTQQVPTVVDEYETFTIGGDWVNADHILVSTDGVNWTTHSGDSFTQTLSLSGLGANSIRVGARNTANDTDPGTEYKEESYDILVENYIKFVELTSNSLIVGVEDSDNKRLKLFLISDNSEVDDKAAGSNVAFTLPLPNEEYRIILFNDLLDVEEDGVNFITGFDDIYFTSITQKQILIQQY